MFTPFKKDLSNYWVASWSLNSSLLWWKNLDSCITLLAPLFQVLKFFVPLKTLEYWEWYLFLPAKIIAPVNNASKEYLES